MRFYLYVTHCVNGLFGNVDTTKMCFSRIRSATNNLFKSTWIFYEDLWRNVLSLDIIELIFSSKYLSDLSLPLPFSHSPSFLYSALKDCFLALIRSFVGIYTAHISHLLFNMFRQPMTLLLLLSIGRNIRHALNFLDSIILGFTLSLALSLRLYLSPAHPFSFSFSLSLSLNSNRFSFRLISFYLSKMNNVPYICSIGSPFDYDTLCAAVCILQIYESIIAEKKKKKERKKRSENMFTTRTKTNRSEIVSDLSFYSHLNAFSPFLLLPKSVRK